MMNLHEVAKLVAEALELRAETPHWGLVKDATGPVLLFKDGSNLSGDYWRCRCEEWLHERGSLFLEWKDWDGHIFTGLWPEMHLDEDIHIECPLAEAPARLVAEVWKRMKER